MIGGIKQSVLLLMFGLATRVFSLPMPLPDWSVRYCSWCPYAIVGDDIVRQTDEQSRECVYEPAIDACMNGGMECVADGEGKRACIISSEW